MENDLKNLIISTYKLDQTEFENLINRYLFNKNVSKHIKKAYKCGEFYNVDEEVIHPRTIKYAQYVFYDCGVCGNERSEELKNVLSLFPGAKKLEKVKMVGKKVLIKGKEFFIVKDTDYVIDKEDKKVFAVVNKSTGTLFPLNFKCVEDLKEKGIKYKHTFEQDESSDNY